MEHLEKTLLLNKLVTKLRRSSYSPITLQLLEIEQKWMDTKLLLMKEQVWLIFLEDIKSKQNVQNNAEILDLELKHQKCWRAMEISNSI